MGGRGAELFLKILSEASKERDLKESQIVQRIKQNMLRLKENYINLHGKSNYEMDHYEAIRSGDIFYRGDIDMYLDDGSSADDWSNQEWDTPDDSDKTFYESSAYEQVIVLPKNFQKKRFISDKKNQLTTTAK